MRAKTSVKPLTHARALTPNADGETASTHEADELAAELAAHRAASRRARTTPRLIRSEGQRMLLALPGTLVEIGRAINATKQSIQQWRDGVKVPDERNRRALAVAYGIPFAAWAGVAGPDEADGQADDDDDDDDDDDADDEPSAADDYRAELRRLRKQRKRPGLSPRDHVHLSEAIQKAIARKAKHERERELLEDRTIRAHPKWRRLKEAITTALLAHPAAARDVEAVIVRLIGSDEDDDEAEE